MITIFKNIKETSTPFHKELAFALKRIEVGKSEELVRAIRKEKDKTIRNEIKKGLPAICFSGVFNKRADDSIVKHSGYICLDFDGYKTKQQMLDYKKSLSEDKYMLSVFVSPSGNGLKAIVKIPDSVDNHKKYFQSLQEYYDSEYFDTTSKNISRVCYESYDPDIYVNMDSELWDTLPEEEYISVSQDDRNKTIAIKDENKTIEILMKWWEKKYGLVEGQRNQNVYILASAFNDYGINKSLAEYILFQFQSKSFPLREIKRTLDSAYSNTHNFGTKFYEDTQTISRIKEDMRRGVLKKDIRQDLSDSDVSDEVIDSVLNEIEESKIVKDFWVKSEKGAITIVHYLFKNFLEDNGFYKFSPHDSNSFIFVKVTNNLIENVREEEIKDFVLNFLEANDDLSIYNFFADKTRFFRDDFLSLLRTIKIHFIMDTKDSSHIYYKNCVVNVTKGDISLIDYIDLDGYVWKDQVVGRDFVVSEEGSDFKKFISNISGDNEKRIESLRSTIGYLLHGYKNPGFSPAVILNDEVITDNPEGGTGKGIFANAISNIKKLSVIDGKQFSFDKSFGYQTVHNDTQVICFDDVRKGFNFERLFSLITEGVTLEKKNKDAVKIPFNKSPKVVITTNYAVMGKGNSFERRKWELELVQHYKGNFTPYDDFGKLLFDDWSEDDWVAFDNYMVNCLQFYLNKGLVRSAFKNVKIRRLISDTAVEFLEWCGLIEGTVPSDRILYDVEIPMDELYRDFIMLNPDFAPRAVRTISRTKFYRWLMAFGKYKTGNKPSEGRTSSGKWIIFNQENKENHGKDREINF